MDRHGHAESAAVARLDFLGEADIGFGSSFGGLQIGGLSAITWDPGRQQYYALADDRSADARFFTLHIALEDGALSPGDVTFTRVTTLATESGAPFVPLSLDPEGLTLGRHGRLFLSSEGDAAALIDPFIATLGRDGQLTGRFEVPAYFLPTTDQSSGIRNNLAFEGLTVTPNGRTLFVGTEDALYQDGPVPTLEAGSPSRILRYDTWSGAETAEYVYLTEPLAAAPVPETQFATNGLVELLALDNRGTLLALERSFSTGVGNAIKLFLVDTRHATDVAGVEALAGAHYRPVEKTLLLDFDDLGLTLDNLEGMTLGPDLPDGRRSLVLVADDNFSATQVTQILAFGLDLDRPGHAAQHGGHDIW